MGFLPHERIRSFVKILIISNFAESLRNFRGPLLNALSDNKRGMEVHAAAPGVSDAGLQAHFAARGICLHETTLQRTGTNPLRDLAYCWRLWRLMCRERPDMVLAYTIKPVIYGILAAWLAGVPRRFALITGLGYAFTNNRTTGLLTRLIRLLYRFALSRTHKVFFQNPDDAALFRSLGLLSVRVPAVVVNGSGVDVARYALEPLPKQTIFLLIARLLGDKGVREYVAAARMVRQRYPQAQFHLVGWIDENPDAIAQAELDAWVASGDVQFGGRLQDVRPAIARATVYVLPSYREGTPRTVLEAMAMGRPVITTDAPGCRETVVDGDNGFLVPVKSVEPLAAAMLKFIEQPELIERMGARSRAIAEEKYDVHKVNAVMLKEMGIE